MTVSTTESVVEHISGGPAFPIPYRFLQDSDIQAVLVDQVGNAETLVLGTQYTLSGAGTQNGGTLTSAYAASVLATPGGSLTISRVMIPVQPTDLRNQGRFLAETHEFVFDRLTMLVQQGIALASRALLRPWGKNYYDAQGRQIKNLGAPTIPGDATNKKYVDDQNNAQDVRIDALSAGLPGTNYAFPWSTTTTQSTQSLTPGFTFASATLYLNGIAQPYGKAFAVVANQIVLAEAIPAGTEVYAILGQSVVPTPPTENAFDLYDYAALRAYTGPAQVIHITKPGIEGFFYQVFASSVDNGGTRIVDISGRVWDRIFTGDIFASWFGAVLDGTSNDTQSIQRSINFCASNGGGRVRLKKGTAVLTASTETDTILAISPTTGLTEYTADTQVCLLLRSGVTLVGDGAKSTILSASSSLNRAVVALYNMDGGGMQSLSVRGGKGIVSFVSNFSNPMSNLVLEDLEIYESLSYGIGMQYGVYKNNRYSRIYIHDTAQDAFDHKARPNETTGAEPYGISFDSILCERYGQTSATESAGIDARGNVQMSKIVCRDFYVPGKNNRGIRFSTGIWKDDDHRIGSDKSSLVDFLIDSGRPDGIGSVGIDILEASGVSIVGGVIENCPTGFLTSDTTTGNGNGDGIKVVGVEVRDARSRAFQAQAPFVTFLGCRAVQGEAWFKSNMGNLVAGQTALTVSKTFDQATVQVFKNGSLLTLTADYSVSGNTIINLVIPSLATDIFLVATPSPLGFVFTDGAERSGTNGTLIGNSTKGVTTPLQVSSTCAPTLTRGPNNFDSLSGYRESVDGSYIEAYGPAADINADIRAKGAADVVLRSKNSRSLVATNPLGAVNWVEVRGSVAGDMARVSPQGSDTNINLLLQGKGSTGTVAIIARNYASDSAAAAAGVPINGIYHTSGSLKIRLT